MLTHTACRCLIALGNPESWYLQEKKHQPWISFYSLIDFLSQTRHFPSNQTRMGEQFLFVFFYLWRNRTVVRKWRCVLPLPSHHPPSHPPSLLNIGVVEPEADHLLAHTILIQHTPSRINHSTISYGRYHSNYRQDWRGGGFSENPPPPAPIIRWLREEQPSLPSSIQWLWTWWSPKDALYNVHTLTLRE